MITVLLPISRTEFLKPVFDCLINLDKPEDTELLIMIDGDVNLERSVDKRLDSLVFKRIQVINFGDKPGEDINSRRYRISAIHNKAKHYVSDDCDYVFLIEDDTVYPKETLTQLFKSFNSVENCAFVEGTQLGRHNAPYVGAWIADDIANPTDITSLLPGTGISAISAGGFYCALTDAELYKTHHFEPFDKVGKNGLSCDVNFGLSLSRQGYRCTMDWTIQTDHIGDKGSVNLGNTKPCQVQFKKQADGQWLCSRV